MFREESKSSNKDRDSESEVEEVSDSEVMAQRKSIIVETKAYS